MKLNQFLFPLAGAVALLAASASVQASTPLDGAAATALAQRNACLACHAVDRRMVGPSYREIATKYKGMDVAKLAASIRAGGSGKWGPVPMPPQPRLSEADSRILAAWVLAGAPAR